MTEQMGASSLGRWETEFRFVFDPPLVLPEGSATPALTAFDLTPLADDVPDLRQRRDVMLDDFLWESLLGVPRW